MHLQNRVLIIDDESTIRDLLETWLRKYNFSADKAENPETAMELISRNEYSIIVVDFTMPKMNGAELIKGIRNLHRKTEIIGISASPCVRDLFYKAGANHFLEKPFNFGKLTSIIRRINLLDE
jgi:DNA-binding NtrC family response regulator